MKWPRSFVNNAMRETGRRHIIPAGQIRSYIVVEYIGVALKMHFMQERTHLNYLEGQGEEVGSERGNIAFADSVETG